MENNIKTKKKLKYKCCCITIIMFFAYIFVSTKEVKAETYDITLGQYQPPEKYSTMDSGNYFYDIYPADHRVDYKKFMKYTYKISDDSVIGLKANTYLDIQGIFVEDVDGNERVVKPYNIIVYALAPGKATLTVYDGKKLIDKFNFTVAADIAISPSSYVDLTSDRYFDTISYTDTKNDYITRANIKEENKLIKKFAKIASKYTTTNQRILAALNAVMNHGATQISEKKYKEMSYQAWKKGTELDGKYKTAHSMLIEKKSTYNGFSIVNRAVLSNLGFDCSADEQDNSVSVFQKYDEYDLYSGDDIGSLSDYEFTAATKLESKYDFSSEDEDTIYRKTHLPAWLIGEDTKLQVVSVGDTTKLSACDLNNNIYSSDTSVVTAKNGKITGVNPGVAIVYRYDDTYCDIFYVLVKNKGTARTIQSKIYTETTKSYFKDSEYAPYIRGGQVGEDSQQLDDWLDLRIYELEPIFGNGSELTTKYFEGKIECYITMNGESEELCTTGLRY